MLLNNISKSTTKRLLSKHAKNNLKYTTTKLFSTAGRNGLVKPNIGVVGATGAVGIEMRNCL